MTSVALRMGRQQVGGGHPSLDLNFVAGCWPAGLSFSRASGATVNCWARYGDNVAANGDFATDVFGWNPIVATTSWVSGKMRVTVTANGGRAEQYGVLQGKKLYRFTATLTGETSTALISVIRGALGGYVPLVQSETVGTGTSRQVTVVFATIDGQEILRVASANNETSGTFTVDNITVQELTLWQPGMDWLGPELAVSFRGSLHASLSAQAAGVTKVTATGVDPYYEYDVTGSGVVGGKTYIFTVDAWTDVGQPPPSALYAYSFPFAEPQSVGIPPTFVRTSSQLSFSFSAARSETAMIVRADGAKNAVGSYFYVAAPRVREQLYTLQNVLLPANIPRIAYDPVTGACLGGMVEPQRTNFIYPSDCKSGTTFYGLSGVANFSLFEPTAVCPDGSLGPRRVSVTTAATMRVGDTTSGTANAVYSGSVWIRTADGATRSCNADLNDGAIAPFTATPVWTRVGASASVGAAYRFMDITLPVGEYQVWGVQIELGTEPSSYIPTSGAAATRAAETPLIGNITPWFNPLEGTAVVEFQAQGPTWPESARVFDFTRAGNSPYYGESYNIKSVSSPGLVGEHNSGGQYSAPGAVAVSPLAVQKAAVQFKVSPSRLAVNGVVNTFGGTPQRATVDRLCFGSVDGGADRWTVPLLFRRFRYYPRAMTAAELQAVTK